MTNQKSNPSDNSPAQKRRKDDPKNSEESAADDATHVFAGDRSTLLRDFNQAKQQEACLILIRGTPQGHRYFLTLPKMTIGRDAAADIVLNDQSVSRNHIAVSKTTGGFILTDLGSSNGTLINDKKIEKGASVELKKEDLIRVGSTLLKFLPAGEFEILFYGNMGLAAHTDALTQIYNKGYLTEALEAEFKRAKALHYDLSLLFFDLDHFKKVNDQFGHAAGDYVLKEFSKLIRERFLRPKDIFARYGGEEFVIILAQTTGNEAFEIAERIRKGIESHPFVFEGKRIPVTSSLGVSEIQTGVDSAQTLLKKADQALYEAKGAGRNCVHFKGV